jgi:quinol monooxygenase YgiN
VPLLAVTVTFRLHPGGALRFGPLLRENARASMTHEPGCLRFDICLPEGGDGHEIFLYELYIDRAAFDSHLASDHFRNFDTATRGIVSEKRIAFFLVDINETPAPMSRCG